MFVGSIEIIEAWLDEIDRVQAIDGPILAHAIQSVGPPPLLCDEIGLADRDLIDDDLDAHYYVTVTTLLASKRASGRRTRAILNDQEAKGPEFWESVSDWVKSTSPRVVSRQSAPDWLLKLNVYFSDEE